MGYNSPAYIHTVYQAMNLSFADRDFYYGDPLFSNQIPIKGLLSKDYAKKRAAEIPIGFNNPKTTPGDPYPFEGKQNPYKSLLEQRATLYNTDTATRKTGVLPKRKHKTAKKVVKPVMTQTKTVDNTASINNFRTVFFQDFSVQIHKKANSRVVLDENNNVHILNN